MTVSRLCIIQTSAVVCAAGRARIHELKHLYGVSRWCNEVSSVLSTFKLYKLSLSSLNMDVEEASHFHHQKHIFLSLQVILQVSLSVFLENQTTAMLNFLSQVSLLNGMFYLTHHTMRWSSIPEMLHLLLRSFPEFSGTERLISALCFSLESVIRVFSHKGCLLS